MLWVWQRCGVMKYSFFIFVIFCLQYANAESAVFIVDESGREVTDVLGPLNEGSRLSLFCETNGGAPSILTWWRDSYLLDDSFVTMPRGIVRNELTLAYLDRGDLMSTLTCQASVPNVTESSKTSVSLDLNLKPLNVYITSLQRPLSAGRKVVLKCQSTGSRPPAIITWWIGSRQLLNASEASYDTTTISKLTFVPQPDDHGHVLSCRATNPVMDGNILEDHRILNIHYVPSLSVTVGTPQSYILEGDVVYFDCNIIANPPVTEVGWHHNGDYLYTNVNEGIKVQNQSLLLHKVKKKHSGNYSCVAANAEGEGVSEHVEINVQYVPYCSPNQRTSYGVPLRESVAIDCIVEANPEKVEFEWYLNNTYRQIKLTGFTLNGTLSTLIYTPKRENDYGIIMCLAKNAAGFQKDPCCFKVSPASVPEAVENCVVYNETNSSAVVHCSAGHDGGLPQEFHLELYSSRGLVVNVIEIYAPEFELYNLPSGTTFIAVVFAMNDQGRSNAVAFSVVTKAQPKAEDAVKFFLISPVLAVLITVIGILVLTAVIILVCSKHWSVKLGEGIQETPSAWEHEEIKPGHQYI